MRDEYTGTTTPPRICLYIPLLHPDSGDVVWTLGVEKSDFMPYTKEQKLLLQVCVRAWVGWGGVEGGRTCLVPTSPPLYRQIRIYGDRPS